MQIYRKLRTKLEELGYKVLTSRDSDIDVDFVTERSRMVNKTNSDIFISIPSTLLVIPTQKRAVFKPTPIAMNLIIQVRLINTGTITQIV